MKLFVQYSVELRGDSDLDDARRHILNVIERFSPEHPSTRSKRKHLRLWANR